MRNKLAERNDSHLPPTKPIGDGFALPIVIVVGIFMILSGLTLTAQLFRSSITSKKNTYKQNSIEIAELGIAKVTDQLNRRFRYLLINCYRKEDDISFNSESSCINAGIGEWGINESPAPTIQAAACLGEINGVARERFNYSEGMIVNEVIDMRSEDNSNGLLGEWSLVSYNFYGDQINGGKGVIEINAKRIHENGNILASTTLKKTMQVKSKACSRRLLQISNPENSPGLMAKSIDLGSDDVIGSGSANIYCTGCANAEDLGRNLDSVITGDVFTGIVKMPAIPSFPSDLRDAVTIGDITPEGQEAVSIESPDAALTAFDPLCEGCIDKSHIRSEGGNPMCITDQAKTVHCLINNINLQGTEDFTINTAQGNRPVLIYLQGDLTTTETSNLTNQDGESVDLAIIGGQQGCGLFPNQSINLSAANTLKGFFYAPCAAMTITGAEQNNDAFCISSDEVIIGFDNQSINNSPEACSQGDLDGAAWVGSWRSNIQNSSAEITVPTNLNAQLFRNFGTNFAVSPIDFVLVGTTDWSISN